MSQKEIRIAVLYSRLSGYTIACLKALKSQKQVKLLLFFWEPNQQSPFRFDNFDWCDCAYSKGDYSPAQIREITLDFNPHLLLIAGWQDKDYLKIAKLLKRRGTKVVSGLDNQWSGTWKQRLGNVTASVYLHPCIDTLWVAGERQAQFAKRLGYTGKKICYGLYCCDWDNFAYFSDASQVKEYKREEAFLFVGRYVPEKGLADLVEAYQLYRSKVNNPWKLYCVGTGPLQSMLQFQEGIHDLGFRQPDSLPEIIHQVSAFVFPSQYEPWGVALQEAAACQLPLICSDACGAGVHLLQDNYNGFLFSAGNVVHLQDCLLRLSQSPKKSLQKMGIRSFELSKQFTPERWSLTLLSTLS